MPAEDTFQLDPLYLAIAGALALLIVAAIVWRLVRRTPAPSVDPEIANMTIDVSALDTIGPVPGAVRLEFYGVPVRLAVLVLAPVGRAHPLPTTEELPTLMEGFLPGMMRVLATHQPIFRRWQPQLSSHGFTAAFFSNMALPGDKGKQTPWCSAAGKFEVDGKQFMVGLIGCAASPNSLSQVTVQHAGQWLDLLRVR